MTLEAFDQRARSTVPVELHTQFLVSIMTGLQVGFLTHIPKSINWCLLEEESHLGESYMSVIGIYFKNIPNRYRKKFEQF